MKSPEEGVNADSVKSEARKVGELERKGRCRGREPHLCNARFFFFSLFGTSWQRITVSCSFFKLQSKPEVKRSSFRGRFGGAEVACPVLGYPAQAEVCSRSPRFGL